MINTKGSGQSYVDCQGFFGSLWRLTSYLSPLTSYISRLHLPYQIRLPSAPVCESFLSLPWARKISLVGAQIFILIDNAKVQKIEMQNKPFSSSFMIYFKC